MSIDKIQLFGKEIEVNLKKGKIEITNYGEYGDNLKKLIMNEKLGGKLLSDKIINIYNKKYGFFDRSVDAVEFEIYYHLFGEILGPIIKKIVPSLIPYDIKSHTRIIDISKSCDKQEKYDKYASKINQIIRILISSGSNFNID